jgi:hypothetical protein
VFSIVSLHPVIPEICDERHFHTSELHSEGFLLPDAANESFEQSVARVPLFVSERGSGFDAVLLKVQVAPLYLRGVADRTA